MKKILYLILLIILLIIIYFISGKLSFNNKLNNTIKYDEKINYSTNINMSIKNKNQSSKIKYKIIKVSNKKKIIISNYSNNKLENKIKKYIIKKNNKETIYTYENNKYKKDNTYEKIKVNYNYLKKSKIKYYDLNKYIIRMKAYDAYNMIYKKEVMEKEDLDYYIDVIIIFDKQNNFIKQISYNIDNLNQTNDKNSKLNYKVKITNSNINNHNTMNIKLEK